jgi:ABC-2 type transport system ATP-binding protein
MAQAGYPILEMKRESLSLEDIFLKLTTDEPAAETTSASANEEKEVTADA